jgi:ribosomal protein uL22
MENNNTIKSNGRDLPISTKHSIAICNAIRGKNLKYAQNLLEDVIIKKKPIIMRGEIPHRAVIGRSGRYPVKAAGCFIKMLKELRANADVKGFSGELFISKAISNLASRPSRSTRIAYGRKKFKRTHVELEAIPK